MRIAVCGAQNTGKSTFIRDFVEAFPMYEVAKNSYRELAKKNPNVKLNQEGDMESQKAIRDSLCDQVMSYKKGSNVIFDRCVYDNLVYSMWLCAKGKGNIDDLFIHRSIPIAREAAKMYDIIFFIPLLDKYPIPIVDDGRRDIDPVFREEVDGIFKAIIKTYHDQTPGFFDFSDCPTIIELFGSREERIAMAKLYLDPKTGSVYGDDQSLLKDIK